MTRETPDLLPEHGFAADRPTGPRTMQGHALARNLRDRDGEVDWDAWVRAIENEAVALATPEPTPAGMEAYGMRNVAVDWTATPEPAPAVLIEALGDILDLSKGEPRMSGGSTFPANAHRMGRIHNRARKAFGEEPLTILSPEPAPAVLDVERLARALDAPGVFEDPLDDAAGLAADIAREYAALPDDVGDKYPL